MNPEKILSIYIGEDNKNISIKTYNGIVTTPMITIWDSHYSLSSNTFRKLIIPLRYIENISIRYHTSTRNMREYSLIFHLFCNISFLVKRRFYDNETDMDFHFSNEIVLPIFSHKADTNIFKFFDNTVGLKNVPTELKQLFVETS
jgi:hypothetical protein